MGHTCRQGIVKELKANWFCPGIHEISDRIIFLCTTCESHQISGRNQYHPGSPRRTTLPFAVLQTDFVHLPSALGSSHSSVTVCTCSGWTDAIRLDKLMPQTLVKILITEMVSHFSIPLGTESDQGTHFTAEINHLLAKTLGYSLRFHTLYHPRSSGQVEHNNQDRKRTLGNICQETRLKCPESLFLALIKIQNTPNRGHGLTPFEVAFGYPMPTGISQTSVVKGTLQGLK